VSVGETTECYLWHGNRNGYRASNSTGVFGSRQNEVLLEFPPPDEPVAAHRSSPNSNDELEIVPLMLDLLRNASTISCYYPHRLGVAPRLVTLGNLDKHKLSKPRHPSNGVSLCLLSPRTTSHAPK
jgi:hypothetical protein